MNPRRVGWPVAIVAMILMVVGAQNCNAYVLKASMVAQDTRPPNSPDPNAPNNPNAPGPRILTDQTRHRNRTIQTTRTIPVDQILLMDQTTQLHLVVRMILIHRRTILTRPAGGSVPVCHLPNPE